MNDHIKKALTVGMQCFHPVDFVSVDNFTAAGVESNPCIWLEKSLIAVSYKKFLIRYNTCMSSSLLEN